MRVPLSPAGHSAGRVVFVALIAMAALLAACAGGATAPAKAGASATVAPQRAWSDAVIYFVLVDRFADGDASNDRNVEATNPGGWHGGDLKGLAAQLDEIADLGATAIWINPVVQQVDKPMPAPGFQHWPFHGYWADDFTRLDPHFGTEADLKAFVDAAHARGLKVLLDVVYNHVGYDSQYLASKPQWIREAHEDCAADPVTCQVGGLPDLRTERPDVREYLFQAHLGLAKRVGADGFRLDTLKHVEHDFWDAHRARTRAELGPQFFLLGEVWGASAESLDEWFAPDEIDAGFDFTFKGSCESFVDGKGRTVAFAAYLGKRDRVRAGHYMVDYLSSHDEPLALADLHGDVAKLKLCVALQMTSGGIPMIYYGEEVARAGAGWPSNRGDMPWGARAVRPGDGVRRDEALRDYYKRLIALRRAHPALETGAFAPLATDGDLLVFLREDAASGDAVVVAINRGDTDAATTVAAPARWANARARDALQDAPAALDAGRLAIVVPAHAARVYVGGG